MHPPSPHPPNALTVAYRNVHSFSGLLIRFLELSDEDQKNGVVAVLNFLSLYDEGEGVRKNSNTLRTFQTQHRPHPFGRNS